MNSRLLGRAFRLLLALGALALTATAAAPVLGARSGGAPVAIVTAERENAVYAVEFPGAHVVRRVHVAPDPTTVAATENGPVVVVSPASGTVTVLAWRTLRPLAVLHAFHSPQLAAIDARGGRVFVTDAATGDVSVIDLAKLRVVDRLQVGIGAHHLALSADGRRIWVALSETATTLVAVDASDPLRLHVALRLRAPVPAHDLAFSPDGKTLWVTSAHAAFVSVLNPQTGRVVARVPAGPAPQHIAFLHGARPWALITSGYGSSIEAVNLRTRRIVARASIPYGSFNIATSGDVIVTSSLLTGEVTELSAPSLRPIARARPAAATRSVAMTVW